MSRMKGSHNNNRSRSITKLTVLFVLANILSMSKIAEASGCFRIEEGSFKCVSNQQTILPVLLINRSYDQMVTLSKYMEACSKAMVNSQQNQITSGNSSNQTLKVQVSEQLIPRNNRLMVILDVPPPNGTCSVVRVHNCRGLSTGIRLDCASSLDIFVR